MKSVILWIILAIPTATCIDKINKENLENCRPSQKSNSILMFDGMYNPYTTGNSKNWECDKVANPKPIPEPKTILSMNYNALDDECYEIYRSSMVLTNAKELLQFGIISGTMMTTVDISTVTFHDSEIKWEKTK